MRFSTFSSHILIVSFIVLHLKDAGKLSAKAVEKESSTDDEDSSDESDDEPAKPLAKVRENHVSSSIF